MNFKRVILICAASAMVIGPGWGCSHTGAVRMDGETGEWAPGDWIASDDEWVWMRVRPDGPVTTLQGSATPTRVFVDIDNDAGTGLAVSMGSGDLGAEFEIRLSPARRDGSAGNGSSVLRHGSGGGVEEIGHAGAGFHFSPSYGSEEYEMRVSREKLGLTGAVTVRIGVEHGGWGRVGEITLGEAAGEHALAGSIPGREPGTLRVMNWNVLWASPLTNPEPFARVMRGLDADVLLLQEWDKTDDSAMTEWFARHAKQPNRRWEAIANEGQGVAIVTRLPVVMRLDEAVTIPGERDVRFLGAILETGQGPVLVGSLHLKCCGRYGSDEDLRRMREAEAISAYITGVIDRVGVRTVVLGGDFNLVGSRPPLDVLAAGLDLDGGDLSVADPGLLGDEAVYTWRDETSSFSPGRLDFMLVGEANAEIRRAFVFDSALVSDGGLAGAGIERGDSSATDHLAVVVDIEVCPGGCD